MITRASSEAAVKEAQIEAIKAAYAQLAPLERKFFYDNVVAMDRGEPNAINGTLDYTYEEWLADIPKWERKMIERAFASPILA